MTMPEPGVPSTRDQRNESVLREFGDYAGAQHVVDSLSDAGFPVEHLRIIGTDLRSVEQITGRMTKGKAALFGAGGGAWFGLFVGLLFGLFAIGSAWVYILLVSLAIGAAWGAVFGFIAHLATRGQRDFSSVRTMEADHYAVMVQSEHLAEATRLLGG